ncbi:hypothetical protein J4H92_09250 [Leucobacter weissii]|uniref:LysE family translocator n=1 Tax=Leucobacter weissii TaxID=1983706 RepID=A0A939MNM9_9MICO|nr:hypothetical protein [Leucobacter weissii]MBO1902132.1 hypothetical protein [Leucobacter weissii]
MPSTEALLGFALAPAILIAVPGPRVMFAIARSLSIGGRGGIATVLGGSRRRMALVRGGGGTLMVGLGVGLAVTGRSS